MIWGTRVLDSGYGDGTRVVDPWGEGIDKLFSMPSLTYDVINSSTMTALTHIIALLTSPTIL